MMNPKPFLKTLVNKPVRAYILNGRFDSFASHQND